MNNMKYLINNEQINRFNTQFESLASVFIERWGGIPFSEKVPLIQLKHLFYACAISHNVNWDFLCENVIPKIYAETQGFELEKIAQLDSAKMEKIFAGYNKPHKIEAKRRSQMLRSLAEEIQNKGDNLFKDLLYIRTLIGKGGFFDCVNDLSVFCEDPLKKKSNLLAHLIIRAKIVKITDEENLEPAIDYHIMRVYLRTGRIKISDKKTCDRLRENATYTLDEITELRQSVRCAMKLMCKQYSQSMATLSFVDWILGREYCDRMTPLCKFGQKSCPVKSLCSSAGMPKEQILSEPKSNHGYY